MSVGRKHFKRNKKNMGYTTTNPECFVFNDGQNNALTAALLNNGMSANALPMMAMMNGGMGGNYFNNPIWALIFLAFFRNGNWFGGENGSDVQTRLSSIQENLNTNQNTQLLMDAIKGNSNSIHELATNLNCDINAVQSAINGVQSAICNVGNQVGMSSAQVINSIQSGNMSLANTLQSCCCNIRQDVLKMGYDNQISNLQQSQLIQNGFAQVGYANAEQTCGIKQAISDQTIAVLNKIDAVEDARKDREIASLTAQLATVNARAERQAELAPINKALADIACKQPSVVTLPYSCATAVPTSLLYGTYGLNTYNGGVFG